ncbi:putative pentatricopeptide repeat-containing protein At1g77010, mitochondrial [Macadamia integrifolia]|uniref:putative pentatricopeptide repeat-containing protein At1g77010, mitochondrial n=1 Tax=Macadamia integrifolia TaxID=60698 RepID=UPI001C4FE345|nr:putative pentatricopeptide repeat-containing protein At1g77010, mitochondrial [Macadamia integrifolia]
MERDLHSYVNLLRSCNINRSIQQGKQLHVHLLKMGVLNSLTFIGNYLLQLYTRWGDLSDARLLFDEMPQRNHFSWNTMIEAYLKSGSKEDSLGLFYSMPHKNDFSWIAVISSLVKSGDLDTAGRLFNEMPVKNGVAWNSIIHGYVRHGYPEQALRLFKDLSSEPSETSQTDNFVLATVIGACANVAALDWGKQIHTRIIVTDVKFDLVLGSSLVNMYGKCGDLDSASHILDLMPESDDFSVSALITGYANCGRLSDARRIFDRISSQCVVVWNSMIAGYVANNEVGEALNLFIRMQKDGIQADPSTLASVLSACISMGNLTKGKQMHAYCYKVGVIHDIIVSSVLVDMYSKCGRPNDACKFFGELKNYDTVLLNSIITLYFSCGRIEDARWVFETMPVRSLISWNSMIVGYSQNGCAVEALELFCEMHRLDLRMDEVSLASAISACASICSLGLGEQIFARGAITGLESDQIISTSLIDLYCKCGNVKDGRKLFEEMKKFDEVPWNSMLVGYATNGYGIEALKLFDEMSHAGVRPNDITFTGVLSACDHCGLVEEGKRWFYSMKWEHQIEPGIEHYSCMIDLFARAGFLKEAMDLINQMPFEADASMWSSVLRGCMSHGDEALGRKVAQYIIMLDSVGSSAYVQLSSLYATSGDWEKSADVRKTMQDRRIRKNPGRSWVDS